MHNETQGKNVENTFGQQTKGWWCLLQYRHTSQRIQFWKKVWKNLLVWYLKKTNIDLPLFFSFFSFEFWINGMDAIRNCQLRIQWHLFRTSFYQFLQPQMLVLKREMFFNNFSWIELKLLSINFKTRSIKCAGYWKYFESDFFFFFSWFVQNEMQKKTWCWKEKWCCLRYDLKWRMNIEILLTVFFLDYFIIHIL